MARTTKPLTNTEIKQAKPRDLVYTLTDGDGLQLRVRPSGSKIWLLDYRRPYIKIRTSLSFGAYPDLSLAEARQKRTEAKALLAKDIDCCCAFNIDQRVVNIKCARTGEARAHWEIIRFAASDRLCVELDYQGSTRR